MRLAVLAVATALLMAGAAQAADREACREVRGRMFAANGAPAFRIGVAGGSRVLGVALPNDRYDDLPADVRQAWDAAAPDGDRFRVDLFGDFRVCHLRQASPRGMEIVRLVGGRRITSRPAR